MEMHRRRDPAGTNTLLHVQMPLPRSHKITRGTFMVFANLSIFNLPPILDGLPDGPVASIQVTGYARFDSYVFHQGCVLTDQTSCVLCSESQNDDSVVDGQALTICEPTADEVLMAQQFYARRTPALTDGALLARPTKGLIKVHVKLQRETTGNTPVYTMSRDNVQFVASEVCFYTLAHCHFIKKAVILRLIQLPIRQQIHCENNAKKTLHQRNVFGFEHLVYIPSHI